MATQLKKPRNIKRFAMQTGRKNIMSEDISRLDDCKLINAKLYLNLEYYSYDDLNDMRFYTTCTRILKAIMDAIFSSRISPLRLFCIMAHDHRLLSETEQIDQENVHTDVRLDFECKSTRTCLQILQPIVSSYTIAWFGTSIIYFAQNHLSDSPTRYKIYDTLQSNAIFFFSMISIDDSCQHGSARIHR